MFRNCRHARKYLRQMYPNVTDGGEAVFNREKKSSNRM